jgi:hypothetical protein
LNFALGHIFAVESKKDAMFSVFKQFAR